MFEKVFPMVTVIVALLLAALGTSLSLERLHGVVLIMRFFETMMPVLAVGALIKYIFGLKSE